MALLAVLLLAALPRGFMPAAGGQGFELVICSADSVLAMAWDPGLPSPERQAEQECPFALLPGALLLPASVEASAAMPLWQPLAINILPLTQTWLHPDRLRPPAQGPPRAHR
jgi:hypothetical protein